MPSSELFTHHLFFHFENTRIVFSAISLFCMHKRDGALSRPGQYENTMHLTFTLHPYNQTIEHRE